MGDICTETQNILQGGDNPIVKKPKLTEKLLSKPPFRFLHDVISEVQRNTGFAPGLFSEMELNAENVKDKDSKVAYLQKIITVVSIVLGQEVPASPLKIVAGLEPENTNVFLQQLGAACLRGPCEDAVQAVLGSEPPPPPPAAAEAPPPPAERPAPPPEKARSRRMDAPPPDQPPPEPAVQRQASMNEGSRSNSRTKERAEDAPPAAAPPPPPPPPAPMMPPAMPLPAAGPARPQSAKKAPPRAPKQELGSMGMALGEGGGAGKPAAAPIVFKEGAGNDDEDVELEVVQEQGTRPRGPARAAAGEAGALVRDLLEAEKQLAGREAEAAGQEDKAGLGGGIVLGGRRKAKAGGESKDDVEAVREGIQRLCQGTNPLGRYLELLAEDSDTLAKELSFWRDERRVFEQRLEDLGKDKGASGGESRSASLVKKLDEEIHSMRGSIQAIKAQILANDEQAIKHGRLHPYSQLERKVREATRKDRWGPHGSLLAEISEASFDPSSRHIILAVLVFRLSYPTHKWRNVQKALIVLDYLLRRGHEEVAELAREELGGPEGLLEGLSARFEHFDDESRDQGVHVRQRAAQVLRLLRDPEALRSEREAAERTGQRMMSGIKAQAQHKRSQSVMPRFGEALRNRFAFSDEGEGSHTKDGASSDSDPEPSTSAAQPPPSLYRGGGSFPVRGRLQRSSADVGVGLPPAGAAASTRALESPKIASAKDYLSRKAVGRNSSIAGSAMGVGGVSRVSHNPGSCSSAAAASSWVSDAENEALIASLKEMLKEPGNRICADCGATPTLWYSANLGVILCNSCAGIHRGLGVHVSFIRSVTLDRHTAADVEFVARTGNEAANRFFEARKPPEVPRPSTMEERKAFAVAKYARRDWVAEGATWPPTGAEMGEEASAATLCTAAGAGAGRPLAPALSALRKQLAEQAKAALQGTLIMKDGPEGPGEAEGRERWSAAGGSGAPHVVGLERASPGSGWSGGRSSAGGDFGAGGSSRSSPMPPQWTNANGWAEAALGRGSGQGSHAAAVMPLLSTRSAGGSGQPAGWALTVQVGRDEGTPPPAAPSVLSPVALPLGHYDPNARAVAAAAQYNPAYRAGSSALQAEAAPLASGVLSPMLQAPSSTPVFSPGSGGAAVQAAAAYRAADLLSMDLLSLATSSGDEWNEGDPRAGFEAPPSVQGPSTAHGATLQAPAPLSGVSASGSSRLTSPHPAPTQLSPPGAFTAGMGPGPADWAANHSPYTARSSTGGAGGAHGHDTAPHAAHSSPPTNHQLESGLSATLSEELEALFSPPPGPLPHVPVNPPLEPYFASQHARPASPLPPPLSGGMHDSLHDNSHPHAPPINPPLDGFIAHDGSDRAASDRHAAHTFIPEPSINPPLTTEPLFPPPPLTVLSHPSTPGQALSPHPTAAFHESLPGGTAPLPAYLIAPNGPVPASVIPMPPPEHVPLPPLLPVPVRTPSPHQAQGAAAASDHPSGPFMAADLLDLGTPARPKMEQGQISYGEPNPSGFPGATMAAVAGQTALYSNGGAVYPPPALAPAASALQRGESQFGEAQPGGRQPGRIERYASSPTLQARGSYWTNLDDEAAAAQPEGRGYTYSHN